MSCALACCTNMAPFTDHGPLITTARKMLRAPDRASDLDVMLMIFYCAVVAPKATLTFENFEDPRRIIELVASLLDIEPSLYHNCRSVMLRQNTLLIQGFGDGLVHLGKLFGSGGCGRRCCTLPPTIATLKIVVGDRTHDDYGALKTRRMAHSFHEFPDIGVKTEHLELEFLDFSFTNAVELSWFLAVLRRKLVVLKTLTFRGSVMDSLMMDQDAVPRTFDMRLQPGLGAILQRRLQFDDHGHFCAMYEKDYGPNGERGEIWD
ncbi:MAG: hypothetical protein Q9174_001669 [Haloplaca sp. 1 TL-2023]